jgi:hypothetical protein
LDFANGMGRWAMLRKDRRAVGGQLAFHIVVVLDGDRQTREPARMPGGPSPESLRLGSRVIQETNGQCINVGLNGTDARGGSLHHLQRGHLGCAKLVDSFSCRKLPKLAHALHPQAAS